MKLAITKQGQSTTPKRKRRRRPWTERQIDYLKKHVRNSTYADIALHLNRHPSSVRYKAIQLGIHRDYCIWYVRDEFGFGTTWHYKQKKWTPEERQFLQQNHKKYLAVEIAKKLQRSYNSVYQQLKVMGLRPLTTYNWAVVLARYQKEEYIDRQNPHL